MLRKSRSVVAVFLLFAALALAVPTITLPRPVLAAAAVTLSPTSGSPPVNAPPIIAVGTEITVTGTGFSGTDTGCTITSGGVSLVIDTSGEPSCAVNSSGQLSARFKVGVNSYYTGALVPVIVTGNPGSDLATAYFTVSPTLLLSPSAVGPSALVNYAGSGFRNGASGTVSACAGYSPVNGEITGALAANPSSCSEDTHGNVLGSFTVASSATPGSYAITFTDLSGSPLATATLVVTGGPFVNFSPSSGPIGTVVTVTGSGFSGGDTQVSIRTMFGPSELEVPANQACNVSAGSIAAGCTFVVSSIALGAALPGYTLSIIGSTGDYAQANFVVLSTLIVNPDNAGTGTTVTLSGSGYTGVLDQSDCFSDMSAFPSPFFGTLTCQINTQGLLIGSFIVDSGAIFGVHNVKMSGAQVVQVSVFTSFTVTSPSLILSPSTGIGGTFVSISGTGFNTADTGCALTSYPLSITLFAASPVAFCSAQVGGQMVGSFAVSSSAPVGTYVVKLSGSPTGDVAYATFILGSPTAQISLSPNTGGVSTSVAITGSGFALADSACTISSPSIALIGSSGACVISNGNVAGSFTTGGSPPQGLSYVQVLGNSQNDVAVALFSVPVILTSTSITTPILTSKTTTSVTSATTSNQVTRTTTTLTIVLGSTRTTYTQTTMMIFGVPTVSTSTTTTTTQLVTVASTMTTTATTTTTFSIVTPHAIAPPAPSMSAINGWTLAAVPLLTLIGLLLLRRLAF